MGEIGVIKTGKMKEVLKLFLIFFKIGSITFGSGYIMISIVEDEIVGKRGWITTQEYLRYVTISTSFPGPIVINLASLIGHQKFGMRGLIAGLLGASLPSFIILLIIAMSFPHIAKEPVVEAIFKGLRPAVVGLILVPVIKFAKDITRWEYPLFIGLAVLMYFHILSPILAIILGVIVGLSISVFSLDKILKKK